MALYACSLCGAHSTEELCRDHQWAAGPLEEAQEPGWHDHDYAPVAAGRTVRLTSLHQWWLARHTPEELYAIGSDLGDVL